MSHNSFNLSLSLFDLREIIASIEKVSNAALWQTCPEIKNEDVFGSNMATNRMRNGLDVASIVYQKPSSSVHFMAYDFLVI